MSRVSSELTSAIREVMYHTQDMSPTAALQKVAEDRGLSLEKTARVAEAVNNLRVLHMYKTSSDKAQDIDLADAAQAIKQAHLVDKSQTALKKTAAVRNLDMYYSNGSDEFFLDARSAELRAPLFDQMLKQADLHDPEIQHAPEYDGMSHLPKLLNKYATLQQMTSDARIAKQNTRDELELGLLKAAQDLKRIPDFDFARFEKAAYLLHGKLVRPLITALAQANNWEQLPAGEKIAHALVQDNTLEHKILAGLITKFAAYTQAFQIAKETAVSDKIYSAAVVGQIKKAVSLSDVLAQGAHSQQVKEYYKWDADLEREAPGSANNASDRFKRDEEISKQLHRQKEMFGAPELKSSSGGGSSGGGSTGVNWPKPATPGPGLFDRIGNIAKSVGSLGDLVGPQKKPALNAAKIRGIAQYAVQSDPILKERNPHAVVQAYKTMLTVSPTLAQDPNAVISFLRHATMGDTVSYVALKDLADTEKSMMGQKMPDRK